jgi:hypothetical protein
MELTTEQKIDAVLLVLNGANVNMNKEDVYIGSNDIKTTRLNVSQNRKDLMNSFEINIALLDINRSIKPKLRIREYKRIIERFGMVPNSRKPLTSFFI